MCISPNWLVPFFDHSQSKISYSFMQGGRGSDYSDRFMIDPDSGEVFEAFQIGCGRCLDCLQLHKIEWVHRIQDEASLYDDNAFITLTYAKGSNAETEVSKNHVQIFLRELRRALYPRKIRYYFCGEYGSKGKRAHYHAVIFNFSFPDRKYFKRDKKGFFVYRSQFLESIWNERFIPGAGFSAVSNVCDKTLEYVTKDMQKMQKLPVNPLTGDPRPSPFVLMSLKPGIGAAAAPSDVPSDGRIWHDGKSVLLPRYYKKLLKRSGKEKEVAYFNKKLVDVANNRKLYEDPDTEIQKYQKKMKILLDKKRF